MTRVVDVSNSASFEDVAVMKLFEASTRNLLAQEAAAGVRQALNVNIVIGELCAEFDASRGICTFLCPRENSSTGVSA